MVAIDFVTVAEALCEPLPSTSDASAVRVMPYLGGEKFE
jgi:hypothetical protein